MARRRIGQEHLRLGDRGSSRTGSLDDLHRLIDWAAIDRHLAPIYASAKGEQAWPPLSLFKALLLAVWYDLSDVKLAEALDDPPRSVASAGLRRRSQRQSARRSSGSVARCWRGTSTGCCLRP